MLIRREAHLVVAKHTSRDLATSPFVRRITKKVQEDCQRGDWLDLLMAWRKNMDFYVDDKATKQDTRFLVKVNTPVVA
jgi:hypothetical protein